MIDRERVIKAYECCKNSFDRICEKCPYEKDCCHDGIPMFVIKEMVALLKEQDNCENCAIAIEDRQSVVRCKDCKHGFRLDDTNYIVCGRPFASNRETHTEEWFCADGKRKEGNK